MIVCGWCGHAVPDDDRCRHCGHVDPKRPYEQRGEPVPDGSGENRRRLAEAEAALRAAGLSVTVERLAERLDVSPRTVSRWREMAAR